MFTLQASHLIRGMHCPTVEGSVEGVRLLKPKQKGDLRTAQRSLSETMSCEFFSCLVKDDLEPRVFVTKAPLERALAHGQTL